MNVAKNSNILVSLKDVEIGFKNKTVLKNVNFNILKNSHIYISGKNGSGKTSLVKVIVRLLKPSKGRITFAKDLKFSYLPEMSERVMHMPMLVKDFINLYAKNSSLNSNDINYILSMFDLDACKNSSIMNISAGTLQKILISRCIIMKPDIVVLDEPFNYIDSEAKARLLKHILLLTKYIGCSLVLIEHNVSQDLLQEDFHTIDLNKFTKDI